METTEEFHGMKIFNGTTPLWIAVRGILSKKVDDFFTCRERVLKTLDPEDIHDLRVASRRLREALALFESCYPAGKLAAIDKTAKKVTRLLGEMRNTDEAYLFFAGLAGELGEPCSSALQPLLSMLQERRAGGGERLKNRLKKVVPGKLRPHYLKLIDAPTLFSSAGTGADPFIPFPDFARDAIGPGISPVLDLLPQASLSGEVEMQHRLRIAIKHFRYRIELFDFLIGKGFKGIHEVVKTYQDILGQMHDLDVFIELVRKTGIPFPIEGLIEAAVIEKRQKLFGDFSRLTTTVPLKDTGERVRRAL